MGIISPSVLKKHGILRLAIPVALLCLVAAGAVGAASHPFLQARIRHLNTPAATIEMRFLPGQGVPAERFFDAYRTYRGLSAENRFRLLSSFQDRLGQLHQRYEQLYRGIPLFGVQMILHERDGRVFYANGTVVEGLTADARPGITEQQAFQAALDYVHADEYMWEDPAMEAFLKREQGNPQATFYPHATLYWTSAGKPMRPENFRLAYRFDIYAKKPLRREYVFVDARTGRVIYTINRIETGDVQGTGLSLYNGMVTMVVDSFAGGFRLREAARGNGMETWDMHHSTDYSTAVDFVDPDTSFTDANAQAGVSAHWGAEATYDYYLTVHGRNSYDNAGGALLSYVHYDVDFNNAFWDGTRMTYGDGDGISFTPLVSLDVAGHEITHGVTQFSANLIYQAESGALNESFSDIFGTLIERFREANAFDWIIGEDITPDGRGIRSMSNPGEFNDPDTYRGLNWAPLNGGDNGGVHTNSGVQNFWFYLLSEGGSGVNDNGDAYSVTGIGPDKAAQIAYRNLTVYLTPSSGYFEARLGAANAAIDLFGYGSPEFQAVLDAWDAVGVYYPIFGPAVTPDPAALTFIAEAGVATDTTFVTLFNMGLQPLTIDSLLVQHPDFQLDPTLSLPVTLPGFQDSVRFWVRFAPSQPGYTRDTLWIASNDSLNPRFPVPLNGFGFVIHPAQNGMFYAVGDQSASGALATVDPQSGTATTVGPTGYETINGIAIEPSSLEIFVTVNNSSGFTDLLRVNATGGDAYLKVHVPQFNLRALAFDRNGDLFMARFANGDLFKVDPGTGQLTQIGSPGIPRLSGLAVNPLTGQLWAISQLNRLYKLDKTTGQATLVGNPGFSRTWDIAFDSQGRLFGLAGSANQAPQLIQIDTTSGAGTLIGSTGMLGLKGLAIAPASPVGIQDNTNRSVPHTLTLAGNFPNPFNPETLIRFGLPASTSVQLVIFNTLGQKVRTLLSGTQALPAGWHQVRWDGRNDAGEPVSSGLYLYQLRAENQQVHGKMMLLK